MENTAELKLDGKSYQLPTLEGSEKERAVDIGALRAKTGYITLDPSYGNTGACTSDITFIDGDEGILRYRGYPIEVLAEKCDFVEISYLLIYGELPTQAQRTAFGQLLRKHAHIETQMQEIFQGFPKDAPPMGMLSSIVSALAAYYPELATNNFEKDLQNFDTTAAMELAAERVTRSKLPYCRPIHKMPASMSREPARVYKKNLTAAYTRRLPPQAPLPKASVLVKLLQSALRVAVKGCGGLDASHCPVSVLPAMPSFTMENRTGACRARRWLRSSCLGSSAPSPGP